MTAPDHDASDPCALRFPVVALVTSAGGLDAVTAVLAPLPPDLPAAVIVAQHLSPDRVSHLADILKRRTALRVCAATDGDQLTPGRVLVVPAARHLIVTADARVGLLDTGALPPARPSADLLLATLAVTCGPRVLAVVLTGRGTDAQAGIRAVTHCGGTVFAQDRRTSAYFGMPGAAIETGLVHDVLACPTSPPPSKPTLSVSIDSPSHCGLAASVAGAHPLPCPRIFTGPRRHILRRRQPPTPPIREPDAVWQPRVRTDLGTGSRYARFRLVCPHPAQ